MLLLRCAVCECWVGYTVRPRTFGCVAMGSAVLCILGSGVNRVQVVLFGFSMRLLCFVQAKTFCRYGCKLS